MIFAYILTSRLIYVKHKWLVAILNTYCFIREYWFTNSISSIRKREFFF
nr:MAG TPA: hypothetical protein [Caudoviricetes sp.]